MALSLTAHVADFIVNTTAAELPAEARRAALRAAIDTSGVLLAGGSEEATQIMREWVAAQGSNGAATVPGLPTGVSPALAALANGTSAHAHDFDDTQVSAYPEHIYGLMTHPSASVWAATLAAAEAANASGADTLTAYLLGLEVACKLCEAVDPLHYIRGFHTTGTMGIFGATAAACRLGELTVAQTQHALGLAASMAAGLRSNFGSMAKPLHPGRAAESGVMAAELAKRGFTAKGDALEAPGGFFKTVAGDLRANDPALLENPLWGYTQTGSAGVKPERVIGRLGQPWSIVPPGISIKPWPSVVLSHPSMATLLELMQSHQLNANDIARIEVYAGSTVRHILYQIPRTGTEGKFSLVYCLALIATRQRATLADFHNESLNDPALQAMMQRVVLQADPEMDTRGLQHISSRIELVLHDGRRLVKEAGAYPGGIDNPLSEQALQEKFQHCAAAALTPAGVATTYENLSQLEELPRIGELTQVWRQASSSQGGTA